MSADMSYPPHEGTLNAIVKEYLEASNFQQTHHTFCAECEQQRRPLSLLEKSPSPDLQSRQSLAEKLEHVKSSLLEMFNSGQKDMFFDIWTHHMPFTYQLLDDAAKLEFYLELYFTIHSSNTSHYDDREERMGQFKRYLENKGESLAKCPEFLPYYALPYVPQPSSHPTYQHLYKETWTSEVYTRVEKYLSKVIHLQLSHDQGTKLYKLYENDKLREKACMNMKEELANSQRRCNGLMKKNKKLQIDYQNMISVTADLVDAVEQSIQGKPLTAEYIKSVCQRMFPNESRSSMDVTRQGSAANFLRTSLSKQPSRDSESGGGHLEQSRSKSESSNTNSREKLTRNSSKESPLLPELDYPKIKADLSSTKDQVRLLLLQALRLQLTDDGITPHVRQALLASYIRHDLLHCSSSQQGQQQHRLLGLVRSSNPDIRQYTFRLLNTLACLSAGRSYLAQAPHLVTVLLDTLKDEGGDMIAKEMLIGVLQKLSLRKSIQALMIEGGVIRWLLETLEEYNSITDYCLEYSVALLMNLCLRQCGKKACEPLAPRLLKVLSSLLGHQNMEICPYVNGVLYSILSLPSIKKHAKHMGFNEILQEHLNDSNTEVKRQIEYIIKQLNMDVSGSGDEESDSDDDDEDDEDDPTILEPELNREEVIAATGNQMTGLELLYTEYIVRRKSSNKSKRREGASNHDKTNHLRRRSEGGERRGEGGERRSECGRVPSSPGHVAGANVLIKRPSESAPTLERSNTGDSNSNSSSLSLPHLDTGRDKTDPLSESRQTTLTTLRLDSTSPPPQARRGSGSSVSSPASKAHDINLPHLPSSHHHRAEQPAYKPLQVQLSEEAREDVSKRSTPRANPHQAPPPENQPYHSTPRPNLQHESPSQRDEMVVQDQPDERKADSVRSRESDASTKRPLNQSTSSPQAVKPVDPQVIIPPEKSLQKLAEIGANVNEYKRAFSSRPMIPRTPEPMELPGDSGDVSGGESAVTRPVPPIQVDYHSPSPVSSARSSIRSSLKSSISVRPSTDSVIASQ